MATLPDGGTVALEHTETFEELGPLDVSLIHEEPWEAPIFVMGGFSVSVSTTEVDAGGSLTVDGEATDEQGDPEAQAPYTAKAVLDGTVKARKSGQTADDGTFSETITLEDPGEHTVFAENDKVGKQFEETMEELGASFDNRQFKGTMEDLGVSFDNRRIAEGWEE
jgi:hypothetical protein